MTAPTHAPCFQRAMVLSILVLCVPSCSSDRTPCYPVRGEIFVTQGKDRTPANGAVVVFHPTAPGPGEAPRPTAHVGEDGKFEVTTYVKGDGAPTGEYTITIEWRPPRPPPPHKPTQTGDRLRGRYADPRTSTVRYVVEKSKDNNVPTIELQLP